MPPRLDDRLNDRAAFDETVVAEARRLLEQFMNRDEILDRVAETLDDPTLAIEELSEQFEAGVWNQVLALSHEAQAEALNTVAELAV